MELRCQKAAELVNASDEQWLVWCDLNAEGDRLGELINESKNVQGSDKNKYKSETMLSFSDKQLKCLIRKPQLAGYGLNWLNCQIALNSITKQSADVGDLDKITR